MTIKTIVILSLLSSCSAQYKGTNPKIVDHFNIDNDALLIVVKVKSTKYTSYYPACEDCIPWSTWYVHDAELLEVINGNFPEKTIKFAMLQHADYIKAIKQEWYVQLEVFENEETIRKLNTKYYVVNENSAFYLNN